MSEAGDKWRQFVGTHRVELFPDLVLQLGENLCDEIDRLQAEVDWQRALLDRLHSVCAGARQGAAEVWDDAEYREGAR